MSEPAPVPADQEEALRDQKRAARANARADRAEGRVRLLLSRAMGAEEARDNARRHCGYLQAQVDQLASELREAREEDWQPIDTAPPGHGLVWLFEPHSMGGFQFVGCRNLDGAWGNNLDCRRQHPTHWRPLAKPPALSDPRPSPAKGGDHGT
jgi:alkanesulfonate monooxygenase SsuD/methylene tetrahydromethanopterin reductase-like flavin-dependent oxidoreductase (luciferase family)